MGTDRMPGVLSGHVILRHKDHDTRETHQKHIHTLFLPSHIQEP